MKINFDYYKEDILYSKYNNEEKIIDYINSYSKSEYNNIFQSDKETDTFLALSELRENIVKWYEFKENSSILEIDAGLGEITGALCDKASKVVSITGLKARAEAISKRHEDKNNLTIICGALNDIELNEKFDYIIFKDSSNKESTLNSTLKYALQYLNEEGKIILLIDNSFGMKYWTGVPYSAETQPYETILNNDSITKNKIEKVLNECNMFYKFYYPLPDYKLANAIFTDDYLPDNVSILRDLTYYEKDDICLFDEVVAYRNLIKDNPELFKLFANSFFIEASFKDELCKREFVFFNNGRKDKYRLITYKKENDNIVYKISSNANANLHLNIIKNNIDILKSQGFNLLDSYYEDGIKSEYVFESSYDKFLIKTFEKQGNEAGKKYIEFFLNEIISKSEKGDKNNSVFKKYDINIPNKLEKEFTYIKYGFWDLLFQNCFYLDNKLYFYDQEWMEYNVPLEYILYRNLLYTRGLEQYISIKDEFIPFFKQLDDKLQEEIREDTMYELTQKRYASINALKSSAYTKQLTINHLNNINSILEHDKNNVIREKDEKQLTINHLNNINSILENENNNLKSENKELLMKKIELEKEIKTMKNSKSWKITAPLRKMLGH